MSCQMIHGWVKVVHVNVYNKWMTIQSYISFSKKQNQKSGLKMENIRHIVWYDESTSLLLIQMTALGGGDNYISPGIDHAVCQLCKMVAPFVRTGTIFEYHSQSGVSLYGSTAFICKWVLQEDDALFHKVRILLEGFHEYSSEFSLMHFPKNRLHSSLPYLVLLRRFNKTHTHIRTLGTLFLMLQMKSC